MKTMAVKAIDRLILVVHGATDPTDEEWEDYIKVVQAHGIDRTMQLIATDGGVPSTAQRRYLNDVLAGRFVPVAVVSSNVRIRTTVTVMSWFNRGIKWFSPSMLRDAVAYLEIPSSRVEVVGRELAALRCQITTGAEP